LSVWTIAGRRLAGTLWLEVRVNVHAADITGFGRQVSGYVWAFHRGGNDVDDVVGYDFQGLQAGNKCVRFADRVSSVRDPVPPEPMTREGVLPFLAEDDSIPNSHCILIRQFPGSP
jgi:hypothetical protein